MTPRFVAGLAVAAAMSAGIATAAYISNHTSVVVSGAGERLLPELVRRANDVAEVSLASASDSITLKARDGQWVVDGSGYPVDRTKLQNILVELARMTKLESKTDNPTKYALLEVDAPAAEGAKGRLLTLKDTNGNTIGEIVLGKPAVGLAGAGGKAQYARIPSEARSWLIQGEIDVKPEIASFADTRLLSLTGFDITAARFRHPGSLALEIKQAGKAEDGTTKYEVMNLPEGAKLKDQSAARHAATDLASIEFTDVRPRKAGVPSKAEVEIETAKGMKLGFKLVEDQGKSWLTLDVLQPGSDKAAADALAAKSKWEFALSEHKAKQFQKTLADLVNAP